MFPEGFRELSRPQVFNLLECLKTTGGLPVAEIARELSISYMGAKQHCEKLHKQGYLSTWRVPRSSAGRPEKLYRITDKCDDMLPQAGVELSLELLSSIASMYGDHAVERLLFQYFETLKNQWLKPVHKGKSIVERATRLADLRGAFGCFCRCHYSPEDGFRIEEYHHPMKRVFAQYPSAIAMEVRMLEGLLGVPVLRKSVEMKHGGSIIVYEISTLG